MHLAILIATMRREGYEFSVSRPEVIFKEGVTGETLEPIEHLFLEVHNDFLGAVSEMLGRRRGRVINIRYGDDGTVYVEYLVPTRGVLGFRQPFLTSTLGTGIYHTLFQDYEPYQGDIDTVVNGSLVSMETGPVSAYAMTNLQQRGIFFIRPGDEVYSGQIVGQNTRDEDLVVNVCKTKHLTNHRASQSAMEEGLNASRNLSLDDYIEYLTEDDLLEVTPLSMRLRKKELQHETRLKAIKRAKKVGV